MTQENFLFRSSKGRGTRCGRMTLASRLTLSGQVRAVATVGLSGPLTVTGYGANPPVTVITRVKLVDKNKNGSPSGPELENCLPFEATLPAARTGPRCSGTTASCSPCTPGQGPLAVR